MSTTQTTAGIEEVDGNTRLSAARWSDLPDDLLGNIRLRFTSQRDRAHLSTVCRPWRAALLRTATPPAPLLLLSPHCRSGRTKHLCGGVPDDCWVMRVPDKAINKSLIGSHDGGWVAAFDFYSHELTIINLFTGADVGICGGRLENSISHVVFSSCPTSSNGCILATVTDQSHSIALCKVGCCQGWTTQKWKNRMFTQIAFYNGDLYGLTYPEEELVIFNIGITEDGSPIFESTHQLDVQRPQRPTAEQDDPKAYECYIVELNGKLCLALRARWLSKHGPFFKIFELVANDAGEDYQYKWVQVKSMGDYALFLGPTSSKALLVTMGSERRGFERNYIYYSKATCSRENNLPGDEFYFWRLDSDRLMYCREEQSIGDGLERTGYFMTGWENAPMWLHPPVLYYS